MGLFAVVLFFALGNASGHVIQTNSLTTTMHIAVRTETVTYQMRWDEASQSYTVAGLSVDYSFSISDLPPNQSLYMWDEVDYVDQSEGYDIVCKYYSEIEYWWD